MFTSSTKREMRQFHVVVVHQRQKNAKKKNDEGVKLLLCSSKPTAFFRSRCLGRCLSSLLREVVKTFAQSKPTTQKIGF